jgi:hypothetical protein
MRDRARTPAGLGANLEGLSLQITARRPPSTVH